MKKTFKVILLILLAVAIVLGALFLIFKNKIMNSIVINQEKTQVENQYDKEKITSAKRKLNIESFEKQIESISKERYDELEKYLLESNVVTIQENMSKNKFNSEELVSFYLKRIKDKDYNKFNSVMELNPDAIEIAKQLDVERKEGKIRSELHGIPILLKDNIGTADKMHNTAGAKALEDAMIKEDSVVAKKLREKGAIILGKANLSEWANYTSSKGASGYSALGGQTHDAYGKFDVGGSSAGSAVATAQNFAPVTLGTETAGSMIYPSSQNSVVGIKPTLGFLSAEGVIPLAESQDCVGPIAKNVEDCAMLLWNLTDNEKYLKTDYKKLLDKDGLKNVKIGLVVNDGVKAMYLKDDEQILKRIVSELEAAGANVKEIKLNNDAISADYSKTLQYEFKTGVERYLSQNAKNTNMKTLSDIVEFNNKDLANNAAFGQDLIEKSKDNKISENENKERVSKNRKKTRDGINEALKDVDVIVTLSNYISNVYAPAGYPAITVPAGYREIKEPIGVTFVGGEFEEDKLIKVSYAYQEATKHRQQPQ